MSNPQAECPPDCAGCALHEATRSVPGCWACAWPPIYVCDGGSNRLCNSCLAYVARPIVVMIGAAQSAAKLSAPSSASVSTASGTPLPVTRAVSEPAVQRLEGAGAFDPQLARRVALREPPPVSSPQLMAMQTRCDKHRNDPKADATGCYACQDRYIAAARAEREMHARGGCMCAPLYLASGSVHPRCPLHGDQPPRANGRAATGER